MPSQKLYTRDAYWAAVPGRYLYWFTYTKNQEFKSFIWQSAPYSKDFTLASVRYRESVDER